MLGNNKCPIRILQSVYKVLCPRASASHHAKLDLIWHLFSSINILFWCENSLAVLWIACAWWMIAEMEEDEVIFSWLSTCRADWNGLSIVYKFFWSDPSLWTYLSWPWSLGLLSYWPEAAVYTVCHVHIVKPMNPNYRCSSPLSLLICILLWLSISVHFSVVIFLPFPHFGSVSRFLSCRFDSVELSGVYTSQSCTAAPLKTLKSNFTVACHSFCVQAG